MRNRTWIRWKQRPPYNHLKQYPKFLKINIIKKNFREQALALKFLHEQLNIAHNDFKLDNIFISGANSKLADFGFARKCDIKLKQDEQEAWKCRNKSNLAPEFIEWIRLQFNNNNGCSENI